MLLQGSHALILSLSKSGKGFSVINPMISQGHGFVLFIIADKNSSLIGVHVIAVSHSTDNASKSLGIEPSRSPHLKILRSSSSWLSSYMKAVLKVAEQNQD